MLRKPRLVWRGRDRQLLRKLYNTLKSIRLRDSIMAAKPDIEGQTKFYFGSPDSPTAQGAVTLLLSYIKDELLPLKA